MGEPASDHARIVAQLRSAAQTFALGGDGTQLLPPQLRPDVALWQQRLACAGERLDFEGWLMGLLTLACLSLRDPS